MLHVQHIVHNVLLLMRDQMPATPLPAHTRTHAD